MPKKVWTSPKIIRLDSNKIQTGVITCGGAEYYGPAACISNVCVVTTIPYVYTCGSGPGGVGPTFIFNDGTANPGTCGTNFMLAGAVCS